MELGGGDLGEFTCGKRWGFLSVLALATTDAEHKVASLTAPLLSLKGSVAGSPVGHAPPKPGPRAMVLVCFCPAAVLKDLLTGDFEQHFRVIFGLGEQRVGEERRGNHGTT